MKEAHERAEATYQKAADQIAAKMEATLLDSAEMRLRLEAAQEAKAIAMAAAEAATAAAATAAEREQAAHARVDELETENAALSAALARVREEAETATAAMTVAEGVVGTLQVRPRAREKPTAARAAVCADSSRRWCG